MTLPQHLEALQKILTRLDGRPIPWVVTGSLGMALQGVPVEVHDIDLQTDPDGAYAIESCLAGFVLEPVRWCESERIRSHLGKLVIDGVQVEIMGGIQKRLENQAWEEPVDVEQYRRWIDVGDMRAPVLSIEYEYRAYLKLGRLEKAKVLRKWLEEYPA